MELTYRLDADEVLRALRVAPRATERNIDLAMDRAALEVSRDQQRTAPKDLSTLWTSIHVSRAGYMRRDIGPGTAYAVDVEDGRRPGRMPPPEALIGWVRRHSGGENNPRALRNRAFALARHIAAHGLRGQAFVRPSGERAERTSLLFWQVRAALDRTLEQAGLA